MTFVIKSKIEFIQVSCIIMGRPFFVPLACFATIQEGMHRQTKGTHDSFGLSYKDLLRVRRIAKRTRVYAACFRCKASKIKCSNIRPCEKCVGTLQERNCTTESLVWSARSRIPTNQQSAERVENAETHTDYFQAQTITAPTSARDQKSKTVIPGVWSSPDVQGEIHPHSIVSLIPGNNPHSPTFPTVNESGYGALLQSSSTTSFSSHTPLPPAPSSWHHPTPLLSPLAASALLGLQLPATPSPLLPPLNMLAHGWLSAQLMGRIPPPSGLLPYVDAGRWGAAGWP